MKINGFEVFYTPHKLEYGYFVKKENNTSNTYRLLHLSPNSDYTYDIDDIVVDLDKLPQEKLHGIYEYAGLKEDSRGEVKAFEFCNFYNYRAFDVEVRAYDNLSYEQMKDFFATYGIKILKENPSKWRKKNEYKDFA